MTPPPVLEGPRVLLRPVEPGDHDALRSFLADPSVARWWGPPRPEIDALGDWLASDEDTWVWTIVVDGDVASSLQASEETEPDYRHAAIDLFLGSAFQGAGIGPEAIRVVARWLF